MNRVLGTFLLWVISLIVVYFVAVFAGGLYALIVDGFVTGYDAVRMMI